MVEVNRASDYGDAVEKTLSTIKEIAMQDERIETVYLSEARGSGGYPIFTWLKVRRKNSGLMDRFLGARDMITMELLSRWVDFTQEPFRAMYRLTDDEPVNCLAPDYLELAKEIAEALNRSVYLPNH